MDYAINIKINISTQEQIWLDEIKIFNGGIIMKKYKILSDKARYLSTTAKDV